MDTLLRLLYDHVYLILFFSLILEFVALPIPGETMMALAGVMGYNGHANYWLMILSGSLGTIIGMQLSYEVGRRLGTRAINKYGKYIGLTKPRMNQATKFFNKYGNIVIFIAYYLPGVRHILGYFSGISRIDSKKFHIYSTLGGIIWVFTFITMGYILGPSWKYVFNLMHKYGLLLLVLFIIIFIIYSIYNKLGKKEFLLDLKKYAKYYIPFILILAIVDILVLFTIGDKGFNKKLVDEVLYFSSGLILLILIFVYIKVNSVNRTTEKLLVVVDYQNDFVDGALGFKGADKIYSSIKEKIEYNLSQNQDVIFTYDTHDENYLNTREGQFLPIEHCMNYTNGHKLYGDLENYTSRAKKVFEKDTFGSIELAKFISKSKYKEIEVCGLVSNICVLSNIILIQNFNKEVKIIVDLNSTHSNEEIVNNTLEVYLKSLGVIVKK